MKSIFSRLIHRSLRGLLLTTMIMVGVSSQITIDPPLQLDSSHSSQISMGNIAWSLDIVSVSAEETGNTDTSANPDKTQSEWMNGFIDFLNAILALAGFLISPLIALAGWLLSPDWTRGDLFGLNESMYKIWILISNVTYFFYAIALILVAVMTIFNSHDYSYKQMLPKLALGILFVPVSWWTVQAVVSVGSTLAVAVVQIPLETIEGAKGNQVDTWIDAPVMPRKVSYDNTGEKSIKDAPKCPQDAAKGKCLSVKEFLTNSSSGPYNLLTVYAYGIFKIQEWDDISEKGFNIGNIFQVFHQVFAGAITFLVFFVLIIALVFILLLRAFQLWVILMFSPLLSFSFAFKSGAFKDTISFGQLIGLAFIPVAVSGVLAFGILLLGSMMSTTTEPKPAAGGGGGSEQIIGIFGDRGTEGSYMGIQTGKSNGKDILTTTFFLGTQKNGMMLEQKGSISADEAKVLDGIAGFFHGTGGIIGKVIIDVIALVIIWIAFKAATSFVKVGQKVMDKLSPLESFAKKLPGYVPIPGVGIGASGVETVMNSRMRMIEQVEQQKVMNSGFAQWAGVDSATKGVETAMSKLSGLVDDMKSGRSSANIVFPNAQKEMQEIINAGGTGRAEYATAAKQFNEVIEKRFGAAYKINEQRQVGQMRKAQDYQMIFNDHGVNNTLPDTTSNVPTTEDLRRAAQGGNINTGANNNSTPPPRAGTVPTITPETDSTGKKYINIGMDSIDLTDRNKKNLIVKSLTQTEAYKNAIKKDELINALKTGGMDEVDAQSVADYIASTQADFFKSAS